MERNLQQEILRDCLRRLDKTKAKNEKWEKYYNRHRRDVQIKVRIYRHRKCDETEIGTGSSDNGNLRDESSGFDRVNGDQMSHEIKEKPNRKNSNAHHKGIQPQTAKWKGSGESRPTIERKTQQGGPVRSRKGRGRNDSPYIEEQTRSSNKNARRGGDQQQQDKERRGEERVRKSLCPWRSCSFADPTPLAHADASRDVLPRGGTSQTD
ncbi:hypothetical protein TNCV_5084151 [Trichonephila clavipes]|nr:hypothetical protein TNCV_5084151 [Trichonephila clavipes]